MNYITSALHCKFIFRFSDVPSGPVEDDESLDEVGVDVDALVPHIEEEEEVFAVVEDERRCLQEWDKTMDDF